MGPRFSPPASNWERYGRSFLVLVLLCCGLERTAKALCGSTASGAVFCRFTCTVYFAGFLRARENNPSFIRPLFSNVTLESAGSWCSGLKRHFFDSQSKVVLSSLPSSLQISAGEEVSPPQAEPSELPPQLHAERCGCQGGGGGHLQVVTASYHNFI